jgi:hypothetical protein
MKRIVWAVILLIGCGSDNDSPGGSGSDGGTSSPDAGGPVSHPICPETSSGTVFPDEIGKFCPMGSNLSLCASGSSSSCKTTGICLWDGSSVTGTHAYCTIGCDPTRKDSCPPRFACKAQGCSSAPPDVCVRVEAEPEDDCEQADAMLAGRGLRLRAVGRAGGRIYVAANVSTPEPGIVVLTRQVGGTGWKLIHDDTESGTIDWRRMTAGDAVYFQIFPGGYQGQRLIRAVGTKVTKETLPSADDPNHSVRQIEVVFETADGAERAVGRSLAGEYFMLARGSQGAWSVTQALDYTLFGSERFTDHGLAATCRRSNEPSDAQPRICVSSDGVAMKVIDPPSGSELRQVLGQSPDDFYLLLKDGLHRRVQGQWITEGVPVEDDYPTLAQAADGSLYFRTDKKLYRLDGGCWRLLAGDRSLDGLVAEKERQFVSLSDYEICKALLD